MIVPALALAQVKSGDEATGDDKEKKSQVIELSPFTISGEKDNGYHAAQTLAGSRTARDLMDIAGSVSVITRAQMDDLNTTDIHKVLQFGIAGIAQNQKGLDDMNIRGFRTQFTLRDGITTWNDKQSTLYDVERVEVIKGPAAMVLGNNSYLGGAVNLVTKVPTQTPSGDIQVSVADQNYLKLTANASGPLYKDKDLEVNGRITLGRLTGDTDKEIETLDETFVGGGLNVYFGKNISLLVNGSYFWDKGYNYYDDFLDYNSTPAVTGATPANPANAVINQYSTRSFSAARSKDSYLNYLNAVINAAFLAKLTENANLRFTYNLYRNRNEGRIVRPLLILDDNHTVSRQDLPYLRIATGQEMQLDVTHKLETSAFVLDTTAGAGERRTTLWNPYSVLSIPNIDTATPNFLAADDAYFAANANPVVGSAYNQESAGLERTIYFQENLSFLKDRVILVGGLRRIEPLIDSVDDHLTGIVTNNPLETFNVHKYGIILRPIPSVSLYYSDSENAFPQFGNVDKYTAGDGLDPLKTSEGWAKEYGIKLNHKLTESLGIYATLTHYDMKKTNVSTFGSLPDGTVGTIQSAADMSQGWEFEYGVEYATTSGRLSLVGAYTKSKSQTADDPTVWAQGFIPMQINLMAKYEWSTGPLKGLMVGGGYYHQDKKRNSAYWLEMPDQYSAFASYKWNKHWSVQLNLNDLSDTRYIVNIAASGLIQTQGGFQSMLGVKYTW
ncbi:MAG: TonB-dependent receptor [Lacunisphaera sp.]